MNEGTIRLLVVDDSGFMRIAIRKMVEAVPEIVVVGEARTGRAAVEMARETKPDVITMDIEMPDMDGLAATQAIMAERPVPIIMLSSLTQAGADMTLRALSMGAVDFISKSSSFVQLDITQIENELRHKILVWGRRAKQTGTKPAAAPALAAVRRDGRALNAVRPPRGLDLVVVGVSTGGPRMFPALLKAMGHINCPVVVAQHMPEIYTASFAAHLKADTGLDVREGQTGMEMSNGTVTILPGGRDGVLGRGIGGKRVLNVRLDPSAPIHPSVDLLFESAARVSACAVAVILTGLGNDGTRGAARFAAAGWPVVVQDPVECVVGGMPGAALEAGHVSHVMAIADIGKLLRQWAA